jgi:hypothetical protein
MPAINRRINEIDPDKDIRIRLTGIVLESGTGKIVLDDSTGRAEIVSEESVKTGDAVRAFCRVFSSETGYELRAEIIQHMPGLDMPLYNKIFHK